ncbi:hypothetical protein ScPMuIL_004544 [Solemya velum]
MKISTCVIVLALAAMAVSIRDDNEFSFDKAINILECEAAYAVCLVMLKKRPQGMYPRLISECGRKKKRCLQRVKRDYD